MELAAQGVLTLVDRAAPARLREAYLRLRARDPATDVIVDVHRLAELTPGTTVILALTPPIPTDDLDWLNLNRPLVSDRRHNVVLWCEDDAAAALARGAPDFFDWISARVDCPPAPAARAVADVKAAIRARAPGIAWAGRGLEDTLAAVRPERPLRRVAVAGYSSMIEALTTRDPGWLVLDGIDAEFDLRRLRWAMAETGRRTIVFRGAIDRTLPGWWTVHAEHVPIAEAVQELARDGGTGSLAALTGLDPAAVLCARFLLRQRIAAGHLEQQLAAASDPRGALARLARPLGWSAAGALAEQTPGWMSASVRQALEAEPARHEPEDDPVVAALRAPPPAPEAWTELGTSALGAGDFEVAIRWLTPALQLLSNEGDLAPRAIVLSQRGRAYHGAGDLALARTDLERAHASAWTAGDASLIVLSASALARVLVDLGEPRRARECLEATSNVSASLGDEEHAMLQDALAVTLAAMRDWDGARGHLERAIELRRKAFAADDHREIASSLKRLATVLGTQGDLSGARLHLEHALDIEERLLGNDHPLLASTLALLASMHWRMNDPRGARAFLERALAILRVAHEEHPASADALMTLARVLSDSGDLEGAHVVIEYALAIQRKVFGDDGQLAGATTRRALSHLLVARGDLAGAVAQLEQALATLRRIFETDDHPDIVDTLRELTRLQRLQDDLQRDGE